AHTERFKRFHVVFDSYSVLVVRDHTTRPRKEEREAEISRDGPFAVRAISVAALVGRQRGPARVRHQAGLFEAPHALAISLRPVALRPARREVQRGALLVDRLRLAVDPAEAQRLLDGGLVLDARLAGWLLVRDEPDARRPVVVALQPAPP